MTEETQVSSGQETKARTSPVKNASSRTKSEPPQGLAQPTGSQCLALCPSRFRGSEAETGPKRIVLGQEGEGCA